MCQSMKRILVCLDDSERAAGVLDAGITLARGLHAKIRLFRAIGVPVEIPSAFYSVSPTDLPDLLQRAGEHRLEEYARHIPAELFDGVTAHVGSPWSAICAMATEMEADLIVLGSHGYGAIDRLLGTTAAKVVNHADCSVLIVRDPASKATSSKP